MNIFLFAAGILCFILGLTHSILGEILIFKNMRDTKKIVPTIVPSNFKKRHLRIIWATWHLVTFFGWCFGVLLIKIAINETKFNEELTQFLLSSITISMFCASLLVFIATKGKHLGWIILFVIGFLTLLHILK